MINLSLLSETDEVAIHRIAYLALVDPFFREEVASRLEIPEMTLTYLTDRLEATLEAYDQEQEGQ